MFDPKHGNKLGIIDIQYQYTMVCAALAAGGKVNDIEPGKKLLLECKKAGVRIYPTNEAFAQGLKTEEFGIGVMWKARVVQWQNAGIPRGGRRAHRRRARLRLGLRHPEERAQQGRRLRLPRRDAGKSAQEAFAVDMGYNPTVTNAVVAPDLNKRIGFTPRSQRLVDLDYAYMPERRRAQGVVGQGTERLGTATRKTRQRSARAQAMATSKSGRQTSRASGRRGSGISPPPCAGPATVFVGARRPAALRPVALQPQPVRWPARMVVRGADTRRTTSSSSPTFYINISVHDADGSRRLHHSSASLPAFPLAYVLARTQSVRRTCSSCWWCCRCSSATRCAPPAG